VTTYTGLKRTAITLAGLLLAGLSTTTLALPISYDIGAGSAPGFSGSWLHSGARQMGRSGYYANGDKFHISGQLTLDLANTSASGILAGSGDFGAGYDDWTLSITGASSGLYSFVGGETDLISLSYLLTSAGGHHSDGMFYFADRDFNGGSREDGPNYISDDYLYLWGNNWVNENGSSDRNSHLQDGGIALGMDLYGERADVPEPGVALLLLTGLVGIGAIRRVSPRGPAQV